jgi:Family of unknown function (DUF6069)
MNFRRITPISNLKVWFLSSIVSSIISTTIFLISQFFGLFEFIVTPAGSDLRWQNVVSGAVTLSLIAMILYCLIQSISPQHVKVLRFIGYGFLVFSFLLPMQLEDANILEKGILMVIHIIIAVIFIEWATAFHKQDTTEVSSSHSTLDKKRISL